MSNQLILGFYNNQKDDGLVFGLQKKTYKKNMSLLRNNFEEIPDVANIISLFLENFEKFNEKGTEFVCDRLQTVFCTHDIKNGFDNDINFKFIVVSEDGENFFYLSGHRETREEILEIAEQMRNLNYQLFKNYWQAQCEGELVTD